MSYHIYRSEDEIKYYIGWTEENTFTNPKTGHIIGSWSHNLHNE